jgi:hypothetical protein
MIEWRQKMSLRTICFASIILLFLFYTQAFAQRAKKSREYLERSNGSQYDRIYNPASVVSMRGKVVKIEKSSPDEGMGDGIHILMATNKEQIEVRLGPSWYVENQDIRFRPGDKIDVTGSRIWSSRNPLIIAAEVKKGDRTLRLRDKQGFPIWGGRKRR